VTLNKGDFVAVCLNWSYIYSGNKEDESIRKVVSVHGEWARLDSSVPNSEGSSSIVNIAIINRVLT